MTKQAELDAIYAKLARDYGKLNDAQVARAIKEVGRVRGDIAELLSEFAEDNGTVKRQRLSRLLRELDGVEKSLRENGTVALTKSINESSEFAINGMNAGTQSAIGKPLISAGIEKLNKQTVDYVIRRFGEDGLVLSDRIWGTSGEIRDSIASVIRSGIIRGDNVGSMVRDVRKAYDAETWKIKRLVVTEGNTAYRVASANSVRDSEVADYVKINENGSRHGNHTNHKCYKLAKVDKYAQGNGIYKPTDTEIYMPHPQCSSYITPVILDKYLTGDFGGSTDNPQNLGELNTVIPKSLPSKRRRDFDGDDDKYQAYKEKRALRNAEIAKANEDTISEITNRKQFLSTHAEAKEWITKNAMASGKVTLDIDELDIRIVSLYCENFERVAKDIPALKNSFKTFRYANASSEEAGGGIMDARNGITFGYKDLKSLVANTSSNISSNYSAGTNLHDIMVHELGHNVDDLLARHGVNGSGRNLYNAKWRQEFFEGKLERDFAIGRRAISNYDTDILNTLSERLSEYAFTNEAEYFAEAFSSIYAGDKRKEVMEFKAWFDNVLDMQARGKNRLVSDKELEQWFEEKLKRGSKK